MDPRRGDGYPILSRGFVLITSADFLVRSAYQMGKSPLLSIYAAALGAGDIFLGFIVSVSTLTGMVLKPTFGVLSDRSGRRLWLIIGTAFFAGMPFVYRFVSTPEQLFAVRMIHGLATAIYGPVTLAYVTELSAKARAERLGWFSIARNAGYVVGPAVAGWMLLTIEPVSVFTIVGLLSGLAFLPVIFLPETVNNPNNNTKSDHLGQKSDRLAFKQQVTMALRAGAKAPAVWIAGILDANIFITVYAVKAFVPLLALSSGANVAVAGAFLAIQEAVHIATNPIGGRLSDRFGFVNMAASGMVVLGGALVLLPHLAMDIAMILPATLIGFAQALVFPSTMALVSKQVDVSHLATSIGLVGSMKNAGKVLGPVIAGLMIHWLDYTYTFIAMGSTLLIGAAIIWYTLQKRAPIDRIINSNPETPNLTE